MEGLTTAAVAILATLRIRFARAVTLGTAIGEVLSRILGPFAANFLEVLLPRDYEKWIPVRLCHARYSNYECSGVASNLLCTCVFLSVLMVQVLIRYGFRYLGVSLSWMLMRVTTGLFTAIRGSSLFITGVCGYLVRYRYMSADIFDEGNPVLVAAWGVLAFAGWSWQLSSSFTLSFPLNILLFPFTVLEQFTVMAVGVSE